MATGDDVKKDIESFKRDSLSTVETNEKNVLPDAEGTNTFFLLIVGILIFFSYLFFISVIVAIEAEKKELERKDEIENFDKSALKKQETIEKNSLPTQEQIEEEKNANA